MLITKIQKGSSHNKKLQNKKLKNENLQNKNLQKENLQNDNLQNVNLQNDNFQNDNLQNKNYKSDFRQYITEITKQLTEIESHEVSAQHFVFPAKITKQQSSVFEQLELNYTCIL